MRKFTRSAARGGAIALGAALLLAGCAAAPEATRGAASLRSAHVGCSAAPEAPTGSEPAASEEPTVDIQPCIVSDEGGFDDRSFNQLGAEGLRAAAEGLGVEPIEVESSSPADYAPNLDSVIAEGCNMVVAVGFSLAEATGAAATANPDINFAIIDDA